MKTSPQIERINQKLVLAKKADPKCKIFGANHHKYHINPPVSESQVLDFEAKYKVRLPECYRAFVLGVGDKKAKQKEQMVGAFYGLYAFGESVGELVDDAEKRLKEPCLLSPKMSDGEWEQLTAPIQALFAKYSELGDDDSDDLDEQIEQKYGELFAGLLPLGTQGCSYSHALVLTGEFAGRVVNVDNELQKPIFCFENNFLDWYERYLDEVISGELLGGGWFGYYRGESTQELLQLYENSNDSDEKQDCINALLHKNPPLSAEILAKIEQLIQKNDENQSDLVEILAQSSYKRAKPHLLALLNSDEKRVYQCLHRYFDEKKPEWIDIVKERLANIADEETFRFATYVLTAKKGDFGVFVVPFTQHSDPKMQITAFYTLGQSQNKQNYLNAFIDGLHSDNADVVRTALQGLSDITDRRLLPYFKAVAERFPTNDDYVLTALNHCLKPFGLDNQSVLDT
ncbi:MAG: SMI1/KNR4 family protein [Capnocytophaga sp.]|nr:SMI1/KNR4 family protein [Capnocytophaga sp.]MDO4228905.1 SMI1/KNR4 family protein [Capnocytophaga sp.]